MKRIKNSASFTLIELVISITMSSIVIFAISSIIFFVMTTLQAAGIERGLQIDMNNLARQIIEGVHNPADGVKYGLRGAYLCSTESGEKGDLQAIKFRYPAGSMMQFSINRDLLDNRDIVVCVFSASNRIVIYKAPAGSTLSIACSVAAYNLVSVNMSVRRTVNGKLLTGSVATSVYLRNM